MAYVSANLNLVAQPFGGVGPRLFMYWNSAADADSVLVGAGFISDGVTKGLQVGDLVDAVQTGTAKYKRYQVTAINTTTKAATLSAPTAIT